MKRLICVVLAIASVFALVSCGDGDLKEFLEVVESTTPTTVKTLTTIATDDEILNGVYTTKLNGDDFDFEYSYERYATVEDEAETYIVTVEGVVYYKDGKYSEDGENWFVNKPSAIPQQFSLNIDKDLFTEYTINADKTSLIATISPENAEAVFGTGNAIAATGNITLAVKTNGIYLTSVSVIYDSSFGRVSVDTSYTYSPVNS